MNKILLTNNVLRKLLPIVVGFFITQMSFGQENFLSGYIIKINGDSLKGYVDYRNWKINPDKIFFKEELSSNKTNYNAIDIKAFGVEGEKYVSAIAETEISPSSLNNITPDPALRIIIDTSFLQCIIQGEKSLYYKVNSFGNDQFYIEMDNKYELLTFKRYLAKRDGKDVAAENKKYLGQLSFYLNSCSDVQTKLNDTQYNTKSLKELFQVYYSCSGTAIEFAKEKEKVQVEFGVLAGMSLTTINFKSDDYKYLVSADFPQSANPAFAVFADIIIPRNQGKLSFYNELSYTSYKADGRYDDITNDEDYTYTFTTLEYSYIKLNNMLRYKYSVGGIDLFANAGISNGYAISETNYKRTEQKFYVTERLEEGLAVDNPRLYEQEYILGLGAKFKNISFEVRKQGGNGISDFVVLASPVSRYYFLLGYRF